MKKFKKIIFLFILLSLVSVHSQELPDEKLTKSINSIEAVGAMLDAADKAENFSGAALISNDDHSFLYKAYGLACRGNQVRNNIDTKFNLASIGKLFTSVGIAQLAQEKKLNLQDPISKYLVGWLDLDIAKEITINDLLIHASGLGSFFNNEKFKLGNASGLYLAVSDYKPLVRDEKPVFKPGTSQLYSNTGYLLLGAIIEAVSGYDYFQYIQKYIFTPANMPNSGFFEMDDPILNLAIGFGRYQDKETIYWKNNLFTNVFKGSPAGGCFSTIGDMQNFAKALISSKLLNEEYTRMVLSGDLRRPKEATGYYNKTIEVQGQKYKGIFSPYGFAGEWNNFGLAIFSKSPLSIGHDGGGMRGINNIFTIYPLHQFIFVLFSNYTGERVIDPRNQITEIINETLLDETKIAR